MWIHACSFDGKATTIPELFPLKICLLSAHHDYIKPIKRGSPCSVIAKRRQLLGQFRLRMIILRKLRELGEFFEQHLFNREELIFCPLKPCGLQNKLPFLGERKWLQDLQMWHVQSCRRCAVQNLKDPIPIQENKRKRNTPSCDFARHKQFNVVISLCRQVMTARRKRNKNFVMQIAQMQSCRFSSLTNYSCKLLFF